MKCSRIQLANYNRHTHSIYVYLILEVKEGGGGYYANHWRSKIWRHYLLHYPLPPECQETPTPTPPTLPHKSTQPPN